MEYGVRSMLYGGLCTLYVLCTLYLTLCTAHSAHTLALVWPVHAVDAHGGKVW